MPSSSKKNKQTKAKAENSKVKAKDGKTNRTVILKVTRDKNNNASPVKETKECDVEPENVEIKSDMHDTNLKQKSSSKFVANDIMTTVDITVIDDLHQSEEDPLNDKQEEEDLYYEDVLMEPEAEDINTFLGVDQEPDVNSEVQFRTKDHTSNQADEVLSIIPSDLEDFVNWIIDSKWKMKEQELLAKHGLTMEKGKSNKTKKCNSMPLGAHRAYYGKVCTLVSAA